jgi:hypothetical protein
MIKPKEGGIIPSPMKTLKTDRTNVSTIDKFFSDQEEILKVLERCKYLNLNKIKITSVIGPIVTFKLLTRRVLYMINLDVCRIKFPSLEGLGVGFIRKISFLESQTIPIGLIGGALRFLIRHNQRHILQGQRILEKVQTKVSK